MKIVVECVQGAVRVWPAGPQGETQVLEEHEVAELDQQYQGVGTATAPRAQPLAPRPGTFKVTVLEGSGELAYANPPNPGAVDGDPNRYLDPDGMPTSQSYSTHDVDTGWSAEFDVVEFNAMTVWIA